MDDVSYLSSHTSDPSDPAFQGIKNLIFYPDGCPCRPIIYPCSVDGTTTHDIHQEVSPGGLHYQKISNGLIDFEDCGEGHDHNYKRAISCVVLFLFVVAIHWSAKTQPASAAHLLYSDSHTLYLSTKMVHWILQEGWRDRRHLCSYRTHVISLGSRFGRRLGSFARKIVPAGPVLVDY